MPPVHVDPIIVCCLFFVVHSHICRGGGEKRGETQRVLMGRSVSPLHVGYGGEHEHKRQRVGGQ